MKEKKMCVEEKDKLHNIINSKKNINFLIFYYEDIKILRMIQESLILILISELEGYSNLVKKFFENSRIFRYF